MADAECRVCGDKLRKDKAYIDANWVVFSVRKKEITLCRDCIKMIGQTIFDDFN